MNLKLRLVRRIELPSYEDLFGSSFRPKVFNTDTNARGEILIIATGANGSRNLYVCKDENLEVLLENMSIAKALWVSQTQVLVALMSHEILLFSTQERRVVYQTQITQASFSDMAYNSRDSILYTSGESGVVYALMGYVWLRGERDPQSGIYLQRGLIIFALIWIVAGWFDLFGMSMANGAHIAGLAVGLAMAFVDSLNARKRK